MDATVAERFRVCKESGGKVLDLSKCGLKTVPEELWVMDSLEELKLGGNGLGILPGGIGNLKKLKILDISQCGLKKLPPELWELEFLEELVVRDNAYMSLPSAIGKLKRLRKLDATSCRSRLIPAKLWKMASLEELCVGDNPLRTLPRNIDKLEKLKKLEVFRCMLTTLPKKLWEMKALEELGLWINPLKKLPSDVKKLERLKILNLYSCELTTLPPEIWEMEVLEELFIGDNPLRSLPRSVGNLKNLKKLYIGSCKLTTLPKTLWKMRGLKELHAPYNPFSKLPSDIGQLKSLRLLNLFACDQLTALPTEVGNLEALEELELWNTPLESLPKSIGKLKMMKRLGVSSCNLTKIPDEVGEMKALEELRLSENPLETLPPSVCQLKGLKILTVSSCKLTALPSEIGDMEALEILGVDSNPLLEQLPCSLGKLKRLKMLLASSCKLISLPLEIGGMEALEQLLLGSNQLESLPSSVGNLKKLKVLNIHSCNFASLPPEIWEMEAMEALVMGKNPLGTLSDNVGNLKKLKQLEISCCGLNSLPLKLAQLENLKDFYVRGNPLTSLPPGARKDANSVLEYLRKVAAEGVKCRRTNLLMVGEAMCGKTTLALSLLGFWGREEDSGITKQVLQWITSLFGNDSDDKISLPECKDRTELIDVLPHTWNPKTVNMKGGDEPLRVRLWDMGGQEVYRPAQQHFFSDWAVYVLMVGMAERKGGGVWKKKNVRGQVEWWLRTIGSSVSVDHAKIVVVASHVDRYAVLEGKKVDEVVKEVKEKVEEVVYDVLAQMEEMGVRMVPRVHGVYAMWADREKPNTTTHMHGVGEIYKEVLDSICNLPYIKDGVLYPKSYMALEDAVQKEIQKERTTECWKEWKDNIAMGGAGLEEYDVAEATAFLHRSGNILYFADARSPELRDLVVLQPQWMMDVFKCVINHNSEMTANTELGDVYMLWKEKGYKKEIWPALLELMEQFLLCYTFDVGKVFIPAFLKPTNSDEAYGEYCKTVDRWKVGEQEHRGRRYDMGHCPQALFHSMMVRCHCEDLKLSQRNWDTAFIITSKEGVALITCDENVSSEQRRTMVVMRVRSSNPSRLAVILEKRILDVLDKLSKGNDLKIRPLHPTLLADGEGRYTELECRLDEVKDYERKFKENKQLRSVPVTECSPLQREHVMLKEDMHSESEATVSGVHSDMEEFLWLEMEYNSADISNEGLKKIGEHAEKAWRLMKRFATIYASDMASALDEIETTDATVGSVNNARRMGALVKEKVEWFIKRYEGLLSLVVEVASRYVQAKRIVWMYNREGEKFKSDHTCNVDVFISHAGPQKGNYGAWVEKELDTYHITNFFDEKSLHLGDDADSKMMYAAVTCKVGYVVLSQDFLQREWPILELCLFAARLKHKKDIGEMHKLAPIPSVMQQDEEFELLPDYHDKVYNDKWVDVLGSLPLPLQQSITGLRMHSVLDTDRVEKIKQRILEVLMKKK